MPKPVLVADAIDETAGGSPSAPRKIAKRATAPRKAAVKKVPPPAPKPTTAKPAPRKITPKSIPAKTATPKRRAVMATSITKDQALLALAAAFRKDAADEEALAKKKRELREAKVTIARGLAADVGMELVEATPAAPVADPVAPIDPVAPVAPVAAGTPTAIQNPLAPGMPEDADGKFFWWPKKPAEEALDADQNDATQWQLVPKLVHDVNERKLKDKINGKSNAGGVSRFRRVTQFTGKL